jgi:hypothetical protein
MLTESRIQDRNAINTAANEIQGHMLRLLSPWEGMKIRKISGRGGNVAKLQAEFDRYCQDHGYNQPGQHAMGQPGRQLLHQPDRHDPGQHQADQH